MKIMATTTPKGENATLIPNGTSKLPIQPVGA